MKVTLLAAITLDGKIAQSPEQVSLEWTSKEDKRFFVSKTKEAGVLVMGRKTFETIGRSLPGREIIVMTREPEKYKNQEGVSYTSETPKEIIHRLTQQNQEEVVIAGGAEIYKQFFASELVTDVFLTVEPVVFGEGVSFVEGHMQTFILQNVEKLGESTVLLHYNI